MWGRMGMGNSAWDLGGLRCQLSVFRRQPTYKAGVFGI